MLKTPAATMPGMTDTLDFVKNLWGSMNLPGASLSGMSMPPLSAEDLDKRITDLKAVESWLNMNLAMLRGTIQTMEVQRATLSTLKTMSDSMAEAMRQSGVSAEKMAGTPFASFFGQPATGAAAPSGATSSASAPTSAGGGGMAQPGTGAPAQDPAAALGMPTALAWWNMLQEQFTQAVASALTPTDGAAKAAPQADATPAPPPPQADTGARPGAQPGAGTGATSGGNGKARVSKPKADKA